MKGCETTNTIFLPKLQQRKRNFCFAFVHLEKPFDVVLRDIVWWTLRKLGIDEWLVRIVQSMDWNAEYQVRVDGTLSDDFLIQVGLQQGSVLCPMLFIIVLKALYREMRAGRHEKLIYIDSLILVSETLEGLKGRLETRRLEKRTGVKRI